MLRIAPELEGVYSNLILEGMKSTEIQEEQRKEVEDSLEYYDSTFPHLMMALLALIKKRLTKHLDKIKKELNAVLFKY